MTCGHPLKQYTCEICTAFETIEALRSREDIAELFRYRLELLESAIDRLSMTVTVLRAENERLDKVIESLSEGK